MDYSDRLKDKDQNSIDPNYCHEQEFGYEKKYFVFSFLSSVIWLSAESRRKSRSDCQIGTVQDTFPC